MNQYASPVYLLFHLAGPGQSNVQCWIFICSIEHYEIEKIVAEIAISRSQPPKISGQYIEFCNPFGFSDLTRAAESFYSIQLSTLTQMFDFFTQTPVIHAHRL